MRWVNGLSSHIIICPLSFGDTPKCSNIQTVVTRLLLVQPHVHPVRIKPLEVPYANVLLTFDTQRPPHHDTHTHAPPPSTLPSFHFLVCERTSFPVIYVIHIFIICPHKGFMAVMVHKILLSFPYNLRSLLSCRKMQWLKERRFGNGFQIKKLLLTLNFFFLPMICLPNWTSVDSSAFVS